MPGRGELPGQRLDPLDELRVGGIARCRETGQVALDVGHEDRHAGLRQLAREELEGLGLARARRPGDEAVAIEHRERDLDARVIEQGAVVHGAAKDDAGLVEGVTGSHGVAERLVHVSSARPSGSAKGRRGVRKRTSGGSAPTTAGSWGGIHMPTEAHG